MSAFSSNFSFWCVMVIGFIVVCHCHPCDGLSRHLGSCVWQIGSQWVNAGYICRRICYCLTCLYWLPVDWCYREHHVQLRIFYVIAIYLNSFFSLAVHWLPSLCIYKQATTWYLFDTACHDLMWHYYSSHVGAYICDAEPFRTICVIRDTLVDLCLDLCIHTTLWFDDNIYL